MNRRRPAVCRVGERILISVEALHSFLKTKEMLPAGLTPYTGLAEDEEGRKTAQRLSENLLRG